jgi:Uncharacterized conserved protein (DUF2190)
MPQARAIVPDSGGVRAGFNNTGSTIAKNRLVKKVATTVDGITPATGATDIIWGVTMQAIADQFSGDVQVQGRAIVEASAAIAVGDKVTGASGGKGATASSTNNIIGIANTAASADGDLFEVDITRGVAP